MSEKFESTTQKIIGENNHIGVLMRELKHLQQRHKDVNATIRKCKQQIEDAKRKRSQLVNLELRE